MNQLIEELKSIANELTLYDDSFRSSDFFETLERLKEISNTIGKSWSGSWLGYQARVYYAGFEVPPSGHHFSREWGNCSFYGDGTTGDWQEFQAENIKKEIFNRAGNPDLSDAEKVAKNGLKLFNDKKEILTAILHASTSSAKDDVFLQKLLEDANAIVPITAKSFIEYKKPKGQISTRDDLAASQGIWVPPHISAVSEIVDLEGPALACQQLAAVARKAFSYLERSQRTKRTESRIGTNVFIGHGGSKLWKELKDFVHERLHLPWDEFNRVPVAGQTNIARLSEMLDAAAIAFLVMTAEDEQRDGRFHARVNVVHEAGLFQGRLGFSKAIILLEEGCEEFSNIEGLGQIRFPKGNISACFEEIRRVLEHQGLIEE
jgi:predicted nucleotide-binding protein